MHKSRTLLYVVLLYHSKAFSTLNGHVETWKKQEREKVHEAAIITLPRGSHRLCISTNGENKEIDKILQGHPEKMGQPEASA